MSHNIMRHVSCANASYFMQPLDMNRDMYTLSRGNLQIKGGNAMQLHEDSLNLHFLLF